MGAWKKTAQRQLPVPGSHKDDQQWNISTTTAAYHDEALMCPETLLHEGLDSSLQYKQKVSTVFVRISVTFSTLHSFISVKKNFDEHVYLTQHAHEP
jgi:hypothetical protein